MEGAGLLQLAAGAQQGDAEGVWGSGGHEDGEEQVQVQSRGQPRAPDSAMSVYEGSGGQQQGLSLDGRPRLSEQRSRAAAAAVDPFEDLVRGQLGGAPKGAGRQ